MSNEPDNEDLKRQAEAELFGGETMPLESAALDSVPTLAPSKIFGDYELIEEIARGGMGVVYKARQLSLNRVVAVKMILAGELAGEEHVQRFYTEAEASAALRHPNIVSIYEVDQLDQQHFFSMEYVEGASLDALIGTDGMDPVDAASIMYSVAEAIHYAHGQGVIHRDLKPQNVLIDADDQPQVTDFGLAKLIESGSDLTRTGTVMGTPAFMSPEQAAGDPGAVGPASDVYSLGALLFATLTGRAPFDDENHLEVLLQVQESEAPSPRGIKKSIPRDLETICLKCLRKDPARRYASAGELAADLDRFIEGEPIHAHRLSLTGRIARWARQKPLAATTYFCSLGFFMVHLFVMLVLKVESEGGLFHWVLTFLMLSIVGAVTIIQWMVDRDRWHSLGVYLFFSVNPILFTVPLAMDQGISGTPVNLYFMMVVVAMLFPEGPRLVWFSVGVGLLCYTGLIIYGLAVCPETLIPIKDRIIFYVLLMSMGLLVHLIMRRTRPVNAATRGQGYRGYRSTYRRGRVGDSTRG